MLSSEQSNEYIKTKIYVAFTSSGIQDAASIYPKYHPDAKIMSNEEILEALKEKCKNIEFIVNKNISQTQKAVSRDIKKQQENISGILFFGSPTEDLTTIGLPIVAVHPLWGNWEYPFFTISKDAKVVKTILPVIPDRDKHVYLSRIEDIAGKIRLIQAISKMKDLRVLVVTDMPILGFYEPDAFQTGSRKKEREEYEKEYLKNLEETFGTVLVPIPQNELFEGIEAVKQKEAENVAKKWINEAQEIKGTNEFQIVRSAKLYLTMKKLMKKYNTQAITTEGYCNFQPAGEGCGILVGYPDGIPSQGLPSTQLLSENIVATSETLIDSLITQQLGLFFANKAGFNGDFMVDPATETVTIGHCELDPDPYGNDKKKAPYIIRNLPHWEENKGGACVQVNLPIGEKVTVAKISMHDKKICVFTGITINGEDYFKYWDDVICRSKLMIKTNAKAISENLDDKIFGNHRVAFYGDLREEFKDLAKLIGFEIIEVDKNGK
ncbi:MAG: hypothetical protein ACTSRI_02050 [Promethearchaeota archaeon]